MNDLTSRRVAIMNRLSAHILNDLRCATVTPSKRSWTLFDLAGPYRFGWMPPVTIGDSEPPLLLISFCPDLLAETTMWLDDDALDTYLTATEAFLDAMVAWPKGPPSQVYAQVQNSLYETSPGVLDLVSQVEMRALDEGLVPGTPQAP